MVSYRCKVEQQWQISSGRAGISSLPVKGFLLFEAVIYLACSILLPLLGYPIFVQIYQAASIEINRSDRIVQAFFNLDRWASDFRYTHQEQRYWKLITSGKVVAIREGPQPGICSWYLKNNNLVRRFAS